MFMRTSGGPFLTAIRISAITMKSPIKVGQVFHIFNASLSLKGLNILLQPSCFPVEVEGKNGKMFRLAEVKMIICYRK